MVLAKGLPTVHCVMMTTIDGKIGSGLPVVNTMNDYLDVYREVDNAVAGEVNVKGNAWVCGRVTSELYFAEGTNTPLLALNNPIEKGDYVANHESSRYFITVDTKGTLRWKTDSISFYPEHGSLHLIVIVNKSTPKEYLAYLRGKGISYVIGGNEDVEFANVLSNLHANFQITNILLEGGGKINGSFMKAGLINEIHLLVLPRVLNKTDAPTLFDNDTNTEAALSHFDLLEAKLMARGSVLLHYGKK